MAKEILLLDAEGRWQRASLGLASITAPAQEVDRWSGGVLAVSPAGRVVSGSVNGGLIRCFDLFSTGVLWEGYETRGNVRAAFMPDGRIVIGAGNSADGTGVLTVVRPESGVREEWTFLIPDLDIEAVFGDATYSYVAGQSSTTNTTWIYTFTNLGSQSETDLFAATTSPTFMPDGDLVAYNPAGTAIIRRNSVAGTLQYSTNFANEALPRGMDAAGNVYVVENVAGMPWWKIAPNGAQPVTAVDNAFTEGAIVDDRLYMVNNARLDEVSKTDLATSLGTVSVPANTYKIYELDVPETSLVPTFAGAWRGWNSDHTSKASVVANGRLVSVAGGDPYDVESPVRQAGRRRLAVHDISVPGTPVLQEQWHPVHMPHLAGPGEHARLAVSGNIVYVGPSIEVWNHALTDRHAASSITAYDFTDPNAPVAVKTVTFAEGTYETSKLRGLQAEGNYLYLLQEDGLLAIFDISVPSDPVLLHTAVDAVNWASTGSSDRAGFVAIGDWLYIFTSANAHIMPVDVSVKTAPVNGTPYATAANGRTITATGTHLVFANTTTLYTLDVSTPGTIVAGGSVSRGSVPGGNIVLDGTGTVAYQKIKVDSSSEVGSINVFDLSTPTSPALATTVTAQAHGRDALDNDSYGLVSEAGYLYEIAENGVAAWSLATPLAPAPTGLDLGAGTSGGAQIAYANGRIYAGGKTGRIDVLDAAALQSKSPRLASFDPWGLTAYDASLDYPQSACFVQGDRLYTWLSAAQTGETLNLKSYDISTTPDAPSLVGTAVTPSPNSRATVSEMTGDGAGNLWATTCYYDSLSPLPDDYLVHWDVSDPDVAPVATVIALNSLTTANTVRGRQIGYGNGVLYVCAQLDGLTEVVLALDVTTPNAPTLFTSEGTITRADARSGIAVLGSVLYTLARDSVSIGVYDMTDPANPVYTDGTTGPPFLTWSGALTGTLLFGDKGEVLDVSNPLVPAYLGVVEVYPVYDQPRFGFVTDTGDVGFTNEDGNIVLYSPYSGALVSWVHPTGNLYIWGGEEHTLQVSVSLSGSASTVTAIEIFRNGVSLGTPTLNTSTGFYELRYTPPNAEALGVTYRADVTADVGGTTSEPIPVNELRFGAPDTIATQTGYTGAVTDVRDDPASPDANWITQDDAGATDGVLRFTFPLPPGGLDEAADAQGFNLWVRKQGLASDPAPLLDVELWEAGSLVATLASNVPITNLTGELLAYVWSATALLDLTGDSAEIRLVATRGVASQPASTTWLAPDAVVAATNYTASGAAALALVDEDPDAPGGDWLTAAGGDLSTVFRATFPAPPVDLAPGAGLQTFKIYARSSASSLATMTVEVRESVNLLRATLASGVAVPQGGQLYTYVWDASVLADISGAGVEIQVLGTGPGGGNPSARASLEIDAVEWGAYTAGYTGYPSGVDVGAVQWDAAITVATGPNGTAAVTLPPLSAAATGTYTPQTWNATGAATLPALSASATGAVTAPEFTATGAATLPALSAAATATNLPKTWNGVGAVTLPALSTSATATAAPPEFTATGSATLPFPTASATATAARPALVATAAVTLPPLATAATGTVAPPEYAATGTVALPAPSATGAATVTPPEFTATGAATLPVLSASATATAGPPSLLATADVALPSLSASATATAAVPAVEGAGAVALPPLSASATATSTIPAIDATGAATLPALIVTASGSTASAVFNAAAGLDLPAFTLAATGAVAVPARNGAVAATLPPLAVAAVGTNVRPEVQASSATTLPSLTAAATGTHAIPERAASATAVIPILSLAAAATAVRPETSGVANLPLPFLTVLATGVRGVARSHTRAPSERSSTAAGQQRGTSAQARRRTMSAGKSRRHTSPTRKK